MIASTANLACVLEKLGRAVRKRHEELEIEFLTCRRSYNNCDTEKGITRVNRINHLPTHIRRDFCDTDRHKFQMAPARGAGVRLLGRFFCRIEQPMVW
jgi:hypothetical protein